MLRASGENSPARGGRIYELSPHGVPGPGVLLRHTVAQQDYTSQAPLQAGVAM